MKVKLEGLVVQVVFPIDGAEEVLSLSLQLLGLRVGVFAFFKEEQGLVEGLCGGMSLLGGVLFLGLMIKCFGVGQAMGLLLAGGKPHQEEEHRYGKMTDTHERTNRKV